MKYIDQDLDTKVDLIIDQISDIKSSPKQVILSNKEFQDKMGISRKTAQKWRDNGKITYSKIGREIYYKLSDVLEMLDRFKIEAIK